MAGLRSLRGTRARGPRGRPRGRFDSAIRHYERAWEDALDAVKQHHH